MTSTDSVLLNKINKWFSDRPLIYAEGLNLLEQIGTDHKIVKDIALMAKYPGSIEYRRGMARIFYFLDHFRNPKRYNQEQSHEEVKKQAKRYLPVFKPRPSDLQQIYIWTNGSRDYELGIKLLCRFSPKYKLHTSLNQPTPRNWRKLRDELNRILRLNDFAEVA